jgi:hypothetical protein
VQSIALGIVNDRLPEPDETIVVTLSSPRNAQVGSIAAATYTIVNDDPMPLAGDVTAWVAVRRGKVHRNPHNGQYQQSVTLTNQATVPLQGPLALVLDKLPRTVRLLHRQGVTRSFAPLGSAYVDVGPLAMEEFSAGASVTVVLAFSNPTRRGVRYVARVVAGTTSP